MTTFLAFVNDEDDKGRFVDSFDGTKQVLGVFDQYRMNKTVFFIR